MYPHRMIEAHEYSRTSDGLTHYKDCQYSNYLCTLHLDHLAMCGVPNKNQPIYGLTVDNLKLHEL